MIQWQTRADLLQVRKAVTNMEKNINPILEIKHLVKFFGEREILKDIEDQKIDYYVDMDLAKNGIEISDLSLSLGLCH